jgi:hypothetical protein
MQWVIMSNAEEGFEVLPLAILTLSHNLDSGASKI